MALVNNGQDADTTGALAGGMAGASYNMEAIPARWLKTLDQDVHSILVLLEKQLADLKKEPVQGSA
jgi:ADP-ribosyl-[dinitrogen reductase] hydrolase